MNYYPISLKRLKPSAISTAAFIVFMFVGNFASSEPLRAPVEGEQLITLNVENMT